ncbi:restriction endonuclease subunit S [Pseudomonas nitroreducens]|uniref:restriction endonuclease subunit S n=1 Tax=Pseudomonas nitroreducens TaxID=46680 RepID=UPI00265913C9|nr:restriction endonuclease subunit S [Pseudomonas nitroreducens]MCP1651397.1 type I restriction enzyme S subunit [Pseudomonas nitroreducens]MCP1684078.1 type I restriction enzyme S subunit [Pseudomonas nitroreducens]
MSSKQQTGDVIEENKQALVPKLRFPEFREAGGWKYIPLNRLAIRAKQKNRDEKIHRVLTNSAEFGVVDQRDFFDKDIATQGKLEGYVVVELGSYVYNPRISSIAPVGPISKNKVGTGVMSPLYTVFKFKDERNDFYEHFFKTTGWHNYMRQASSTGARHDRMAISSDDFMAMPLPVSSAGEQQKIADCISSMDELIAAQGRKVDALKIHKKGLMQLLFPREGETQPRLRFPEFQNTGEWQTLPLAALADKIMVGIASAATHAYRESGVPMLRNQNIKEGKIDDSSLLFIDPVYEAAHKNKRLRAGDVITVRTGYPGLSAVVPDRYNNAQCFTSLITRPKKSVLDADFLCALINSEIGKRFILGAEAGGAQKNVNAGALEALPVYLPEIPEQQRLATCLSSLDALITAETQKHEALKTHKKGLMQQLFPSAEVVEA